jgi:hypothetical protein
MTESKIVVLPERDEMLRRLRSVLNVDHVNGGLYPLLLEYAGRAHEGSGVVMMLVLAISDYTKGLPPQVSSLLLTRLRAYVTALIDNEEARSEAFRMMDESGL